MSDETIPADHHGPARGDAVPVEGERRDAAFEIAAWLGDPRSVAVHQAREERDARQRDVARLSSTLASIATALGMDPGALPGAVVERVETLVRDLAYARGTYADADAFDLLRAEALDGEGVVDTVRRLVRRDAERVTLERNTAIAALDAARQAREERDAHRADAERLERERDEAERDAQRFVDAIGEAAIAAGVGDALTDGQPHTADEIAIARVGAMGAEIARLTERLGYYERGHYDGLLADLRRRLEATEAKR